MKISKLIKMRKLSIIAGFLLMLSNTLCAQQQTIQLWPDTVPNSKQVSNYNLIVDTTSSWSFTRHITHPTLDIYLAKGENATGASIVICPGGGYWGLAFSHEGSDVAKWLNKKGISAFVLKYRLPDDSIMQNKTIGPLQDAQEAIRTVRRNADEWNIDPSAIGIMGFSAGGHLAATLSTHYKQNVYTVNDNISARPDFSVLIYPVISMDVKITHKGSRAALLGDNPTKALISLYSNELQVDSLTPPAFMVHSFDDGTVPVENSINYALAMKNAGTSCELHLYHSGGHGFGMGRSVHTETNWTEALLKWLKSMDIAAL